MKHRRIAAGLAPLMLSSLVVFAAETPAPAPSSGVQFSGNFDAYYGYNFNSPAPVVNPASTSGAMPQPQNAYREFDMFDNQLSINLVELSIKKSVGEASFHADFDFGHSTDMLHRLTDGSTIDEVTKHVGQAILSWNPSAVPALTVNVGKFYSFMGWETPKSKDNWQYSRSLLFSSGSPTWHTGLNVAYEILPKKLTAGVYLLNGWNAVYDVNTAKTVGAQISYTPIDTLTLTYNVIRGAEQPSNNTDIRTAHDANLVWSLTPEFFLALDILTGSENYGPLVTATWNVGEISLRYNVTAKWYVSPRFEMYRDNSGVPAHAGSLGFGVPQTIDSTTITTGLIVTDGLEARLEGRRDHSTVESFPTQGLPKDNQTTATVAFLYSF